jgi:hypothetical protein
MLCKYCSNIDLDALVSKEGYKHHASCADLIKSSRDGCNSCSLIRNTGTEPGVDLTNEYDVGPLDTQIVARVVFETPGNYNKIQFCQETRRRETNRFLDDEGPDSEPPKGMQSYWCFLPIAANPDGM